MTLTLYTLHVLAAAHERAAAARRPHRALAGCTWPWRWSWPPSGARWSGAARWRQPRPGSPRRVAAATVRSVITVGLTGGIGSGKSEVARLLAAHGAVRRRRRRAGPGGGRAGYAGLAAVVAEFGPEVLARRRLAGPGRARPGRVRRPGPAGRAERDRAPARRAAQRRADGAAAPADAVVVYDVPLLVENGLQDGYDVVVVVDAAGRRTARAGWSARGGCPRRTRGPGWRPRRPGSERLAVADVVIDNDGDLDAPRTGRSTSSGHGCSRPPALSHAARTAGRAVGRAVVR